MNVKNKTIDQDGKYQELFEDVFHAAYDVIFMLDREGKFIQINRRAECLTGYSQSELLTKDPVRDLVISEDRE